MIQGIETEIDNIIDNHYSNTPMIDTNEDSDDVYAGGSIPEHLEYLSSDNIKLLQQLFKSRL